MIRRHDHRDLPWLVIGGAIALYAVWAVGAVAAGASPWLCIVGAALLYLAVLFAFTSLWFALAWLFRAERPPEMRIGLAASARLFWDEMRAIAPFRPRMALYRFGWRIRRPRRAPAPVLLLHGVLCNAGAMRGLRRTSLARKIGPVYTMIATALRSSRSTLFADQVAAKIDAILGATGASRVALVGHSMGGIVARAYLRRYGGDKVGDVMTLGAPHHGSVHAWLFPGRLPRAAAAGERVARGANRCRECATAGHARRVALVMARLDGGAADERATRRRREYRAPGIGHNALLGDHRVFALVAAELARVAGAR